MIQRRKIYMKLLFIVSNAFPIYTARCKERSLEWDDHCYAFHAEKMTRDAASSVCRQQGGYLAVLNSRQEENFIARYLFRNNAMYSDGADFSQYRRKEESLKKAKENLQREFCKHHLQGILNQKPINVLEKNKIPMGTPERAMLTTPPAFSIRRSFIPGASLGVWSNTFVPQNTVLAEYEGDIEEHTKDFTYSWQVKLDQHTHYINGKNKSTSNWLRYVNCARNAFEENTDTFNCGLKKFYFTTKDVYPNSELLVWYGTAYGEWLGIKKINPENDYPGGSWNIRIGSLLHVRDKWWKNSDNTNVTYTNWARDTISKTHDRIIHLILTNRNGKWQWIPERDYSYYLKENNMKFPFICETPG